MNRSPAGAGARGWGCAGPQVDTSVHGGPGTHTGGCDFINLDFFLSYYNKYINEIAYSYAREKLNSVERCKSKIFSLSSSFFFTVIFSQNKSIAQISSQYFLSE
jgi:hypothetical protein